MSTLKSALEQASLLYTKCYCEENIYHLIKSLSDLGKLDKIYAVFISNANRSVPIWCQKSAPSGQPVIWDYHVICVAKSSDWLVYDFDSRLGIPIQFEKYVNFALRPKVELPPNLEPRFRIVSGSDYIKHFASDRSHMKKGTDWLSPPPKTPLIKSGAETNNLDRFIDMTPSTGFGKVLDQEIMKDLLLINANADHPVEHDFDFNSFNSSAQDDFLVPSIKRRKCHSPHRSPKPLQEDFISLDTFELYRSNPWVCLYSNLRDQCSSPADSEILKIGRKTEDAHERSYPPVHARSLVDFVNTASLQEELLNYESIDLSQFKNTTHARDVVWKAASTKLIIPDDAIGISELTREELSACATLRLMPEVYMKIKKLIITASFVIGPFRKRDAQNWFRIDVNKVSAIYEWFYGLGWITSTNQEWTKFLEKYQKPF